ncbi:hypothetical protein [Streptomyces sp. NPDC051569]|uniref:hypothetical protein n=1 Tax=Streptomyces sp. NPDC051569 TaxID=3365661 RepID=UPI0037B0FE3F
MLAVVGVSFSRAGHVSYLLDDDGMFDWIQDADDDLSRIILEMGDTRWSRGIVGISLMFSGSAQGGDLLFQPGRSVISFLISINRKNLSKSSKFCDLGWYLDRLVPALEPLGLVEIEARDSE